MLAISTSLLRDEGPLPPLVAAILRRLVESLGCGTAPCLFFLFCGVWLWAGVLLIVSSARRSFFDVLVAG